jgi:hypothetical protein
MTPFIPQPRRPYLYSDEVTATIPPNRLSTQIRVHVPRHPRWHRSTQDEACPQQVTPADGEAKRSTPVKSLRYRGSCSHRIRRKMAAPEATFFVFLFRLVSISPFYHKCNPSPILGNYKRGGTDTHIWGRQTPTSRYDGHTLR